VQEVTKELATEIKSEIREVISQVEDVLSDATEISSTNSSFEKPQNGSNNRSDSVSTEHVVDYLAEVTKDIVSEMKTEIRGMVDEILPPSADRLSSSPSAKSRHGLGDGADARGGGVGASQDSGINTASETDSERGPKECLPCRRKEEGDGSAFACPADPDSEAMKKVSALRRSSRSGISPETSSTETDKKKAVSAQRLKAKGGWHCPPKNIWKPTIEVGTV